MTDLVYLTVPFAEKEEVKRLGGRWDGQRKSWYVPRGGSLQSQAKPTSRP